MFTNRKLGLRVYDFLAGVKRANEMFPKMKHCEESRLLKKEA